MIVTMPSGVMRMNAFSVVSGEAPRRAPTACIAFNGST